MPRDGSGQYSLPNPPVLDGAIIFAAEENITRDDMAAALTNSMARNGAAVATASQPMGGFRHTSVGDGQAATDYAALGQVPWRILSRQSVSSVINLDMALPAGFSQFKLEIHQLGTVSASAAELLILVSFNSGATYDAMVAGYTSSRLFTQGGATAGNIISSPSEAMPITSLFKENQNWNKASVTIDAGGTLRPPTFGSTAYIFSQDSAYKVFMSYGARNTNGTATNIRMSLSTASNPAFLMSGIFVLTGIV